MRARTRRLLLASSQGPARAMSCCYGPATGTRDHASRQCVTASQAGRQEGVLVPCTTDSCCARACMGTGTAAVWLPVAGSYLYSRGTAENGAGCMMASASAAAVWLAGCLACLQHAHEITALNTTLVQSAFECVLCLRVSCGIPTPTYGQELARLRLITLLLARRWRSLHRQCSDDSRLIY